MANEAAIRYDVQLVAGGEHVSFQGADYRLLGEGGVLLICRRRPDIACRGDNDELVSAYAPSAWKELHAVDGEGQVVRG